MGKFKDAITDVTPKLIWELPSGGVMESRGQAVAEHAEAQFEDWYVEAEYSPSDKVSADEMMQWLQVNADDIREFLDLTTCN